MQIDNLQFSEMMSKEPFERIKQSKRKGHKMKNLLKRLMKIILPDATVEARYEKLLERFAIEASGIKGQIAFQVNGTASIILSRYDYWRFKFGSVELALPNVDTQIQTAVEGWVRRAIGNGDLRISHLVQRKMDSYLVQLISFLDGKIPGIKLTQISLHTLEMDTKENYMRPI